MDDLEFIAASVVVRFEDKSKSGEVDLVVRNTNRVGLDRDDVTRLRDWLTEWLNAAP